MSGIAGQVTRKDGRITEFPSAVDKAFKWLWGVSLLMPAVMLVNGAFDATFSFHPAVAVIVTILPFGIVSTGIIAALRDGKWGIVAYSSVICLMNYFSMELECHTVGEMLVTRGTAVLCIAIAITILRNDLRYSLRPFWYSMQAMRQLQEQMSNMKAARDAKKAGRPFDPKKVIDAEAMVREAAAKTGHEVPAHMAGGFNLKPGFRQESKDASRRSGSAASKQLRKRR